MSVHCELIFLHTVLSLTTNRAGLTGPTSLILFSNPASIVCA